MNIVIIKNCEKHGLTNFTKYGKYYKCNKCMVEYDYQKRHRIKEKLVEYKGGKCEICGYDKCINALDFHHLNPEEKEFALNTANYNKSFDLLKKEVDKCILVCANCHREIHYNLNEERRRGYFNTTNQVKRKKDSLNINLIQEDINNSMLQQDIAKKYNVSISTLKRFIKENNLNKKRINISSFKLLEVYSENPTYSYLSKQFGYSTKAIKNYCIENNFIEEMNKIRKTFKLKPIKNKKIYK